MITVRVPASTSNLGAGFDALGLALDIWLVATLGDEPGEAEYAGTLAGMEPARDLILQTIGRAALDGRRRLSVRSDIPIGKGLGSSAAALVAGAALRDLLGTGRLNRDAAFRHAAAVERHPDNAAPAAYGGLVLAAARPTPLPFHASLGVALAVPEEGLDTQRARAMLPPTLPRETAVAQAARAAALVQGLATGDGALIGFGMEDQIAVPHRRTLIPGYEAAVAAGRTAGAYGVTISGAGSALLAIGSRDRAADIASRMAAELTQATALAPAVAEHGVEVVKGEVREGGSRTREG